MAALAGLDGMWRVHTWRVARPHIAAADILGTGLAARPAAICGAAYRGSPANSRGPRARLT